MQVQPDWPFTPPPPTADASEADVSWGGFVASATAVMLLVLAAKALGFVEKLALAYFEGSSGTMDTYFAAFQVAFFFYVIIDDIVTPVFLAQYTMVRERYGEGEAFRFARRVVATTVFFLSSTVFLGEVFVTWLSRLIAPGFDAEQTTQTIALLRWTLPAGLAMGLAALTYVFLNAHQLFAWPAFAGAAFKAMMVFGIILLVPIIGIQGAALAVCAAAALQLTLHILGLRLWVRPLARYVAHDLSVPPQCRAMIRLMIPLAVGTLAAQACLFVDNACASRLQPGSIAALGYARRLVDLPILLIPGVLGTVAFPRLANLAASHNTQAMMVFVARLIEFCLIVFLPICVVCLVASEDIVRFVFARGRFDEQAISTTSLALTVFSIGFVAYAVEIPILRAYYASMDTTTPTVIGLVFVSLNIAMTVLLTPLLGIIAVPLAIALQKWLKVLVLIGILAWRHRGPWRSRFVRRLWRIAVGGSAFFVTFTFCSGWTEANLNSGINPVVELAASSLAALAAYLVVLVVLGVLPSKDFVRPSQR